jgi:hypothetical protein
MTSYQIKFFKNLTNSDGHRFKVLQRVIVSQSESCDEAVRIAQRRFEGLENVVDWRLHADFCEASPETQAPQVGNAA